MQSGPLLVVYALPLVMIWALYWGLRRREETRSRRVREAATESGLLEPASLHPIIDPTRCFGCGACLRACPEGRILGLVNGKAELVAPAECIGHGACKAACPTEAITLVFGTETRGVDIPEVDVDFQTNVRGIFVAGELGGMGLVRNAIEQGRQAIESISRLPARGRSEAYDVVIIGGGPAGFSASLAAIERSLRFVTIEQDSFGGTVAHYPRGKMVMTAPAMLPLIGKVKFKEVRKEALLEFWKEAARKTGLKIKYGERCEGIVKLAPDFEVRTTRAAYRTRSVLLAIGRRGTPRRLEVPGEDQPKVVYRLLDPEQYRGQHVLVVGGGDSALEAAASIAEENGTLVTLSHRSDTFSRAKTKNRQRVDAACHSRRLHVMMRSSVARIGANDVDIMHDGGITTIPNDAVIICAGGVLPSAFLKSIGIKVETKYGTV